MGRVLKSALEDREVFDIPYIYMKDLLPYLTILNEIWRKLGLASAFLHAIALKVRERDDLLKEDEAKKRKKNLLIRLWNQQDEKRYCNFGSGIYNGTVQSCL